MVKALDYRSRGPSSSTDKCIIQLFVSLLCCNNEWISVWLQKLLRWDETKKMCWDAWDRAWGKVQVFSGLVGGLIAALNYVYVECIFNLGKIRITNLITRPYSLCNLTLTKRKWGDREGGSRSSPWDMSCPRKLFLDERKSSETSARTKTSETSAASLSAGQPRSDFWKKIYIHQPSTCAIIFSFH